MSTSSLKIDPDNLPDEGIDLAGTLPKAALALDPADKVQPLSDLEYAIHVQRDDAGLMLLGTLDATFELECGRCLERFPMQMTLSDYVGEVEIEGENSHATAITIIIINTSWMTEAPFSCHICHSQCQSDQSQKSQLIFCFLLFVQATSFF